jgi:hypothetical protein
MEEMARCIVAVHDYWTDPCFADDLRTLQQEHREYTAMLANALRNATAAVPVSISAITFCG